MLGGIGWQAMLLATPGLLLGLVLHELAHAWTADRLGDPTARLAGRLTLNPLAHLDPLGTVLLLLFGFGWARPTPVEPANLRSPRRDDVLVTAAGPLANLGLAFAALLALRALPGLGASGASALWTVAAVNVYLAVFNLLPVPPLDGSHLLFGLAGLSRERSAQIQQMGGLLLLLLVATRRVGDFLAPAAGWLLGQLARAAGLG
ncbi:MAG: site-2 protease family protein [Firmicutes bacterium]|nr:site-2 protease family protein [Bacillota bacterium]